MASAVTRATGSAFVTVTAKVSIVIGIAAVLYAGVQVIAATVVLGQVDNDALLGFLAAHSAPASATWVLTHLTTLAVAFLAVCTAISALVPATVRFDGAGVVIGGTLAVTPAAGASYAQGWGDTTIDLSRAVTAPGTPVVNLAKGRGATTVLVPEDATIRLQAATPSTVTVLEPGAAAQTYTCDVDVEDCDTNVTNGPSGTVDAVVRVAQIDELTIQRVEK